METQYVSVMTDIPLKIVVLVSNEKCMYYNVSGGFILYRLDYLKGIAQAINARTFARIFACNFAGTFARTYAYTAQA